MSSPFCTFEVGSLVCAKCGARMDNTPPLCPMATLKSTEAPDTLLLAASASAKTFGWSLQDWLKATKEAW